MGLSRSVEGRWLGGVCAGAAPALGVSPSWARAGVVALALLNGPPVILAYLAACVLLPEAGSDASAQDPAQGQDRGTPASGTPVAAVAAVAVGALLIVSEVAGRLPQALVLPILLVGAGAALVWGRTGLTSSGPMPPSLPLRVALGVTFVLAGGVAVLATVSDLDSLGASLAGAVVVLAGMTFMAGPGVVRLVRKLREERTQRIRSEERAEVATHLHDGVLQTLALIQQRSDDGRSVRSLARRQERELRTWLYGIGGTESVPTSLAALFRAYLADLEDHYAVSLEIVVVGDAALDAAGRALAEAGREAARNAARHAGVDVIDVYLEVEDDRLAIYVRDRGRGFDPQAVAADRRGLADSVIGRVRRHGGDATVRSGAGEGTEVELWVPRTPAPADHIVEGTSP